MIRTVSGIVLLILHLTVCILIWAGIRSGMLKVKKYLIIPVIFVPVWGALSMLILHLQVFSKAENSRKIGIEKLQVNEEIYKNNFRLSFIKLSARHKQLWKFISVLIFF